MLSVRTLLASAALATAAITIAAPAIAGGKAPPSFVAEPAIQNIGSAALDGVFGEAAGIQTNLNGIYKNLTDARNNVNTTLGVAADAPVATAMADLKTKASGKLKVAMEGTKPKLKASDAVPENVQKGLDATNNLVDAGQNAVDGAMKLKDQAVALVTKLGTPAIAAELPKLLGNKVGSANINMIKVQPTNIQVIADQVTGIFNDIKAAFGG